MPYQIKNGIIYSGNAVTLTQAQYDALTTAEKNNGTVYYIYDSDAMIEAQEVGLDGGNVEDLAGSVATFETSPSTAVHAEGEYILYQAQLYKVTSAIAVGEDLTVGSNIEATNVGNELNNGLTTQIYNGAWTATSSASLNAPLTEAVSIPSGTYLLILRAPTMGGSGPSVTLKLNNVDLNVYATMSYQTGVVTAQVESTSVLQAFSSASASTSYANINRGGITAIRLGN